MPAIRDEEWKLVESFKEGLDLLVQKDNPCKSLRFSGLAIKSNPNRGIEKEVVDQIVQGMQETQCDDICLDWLNMEENAVAALKGIAALHQKKFRSFHLTMIDLSTPTRLQPICDIISNKVKIIDLVLTFCQIDDKNVDSLARALQANDTILSLNINFNLLQREGYKTLAKSLVINNTLRYLEAKLNKAEKGDLKAFIADIQENHHLEFIDVGQADDIDGIIKKNNIPMKAEKKKTKKTSILPKASSKENKEAKPSGAAVEEVNAEGTVVVNDVGETPSDDLYNDVKNLVTRNKHERKEREKTRKVTLLEEVLATEAKTIRASLKNSKILFLGEKATGKTFFAHCLVHQLYESAASNPVDQVNKLRRFKTVSNARVTELGWTKISSFHHVDMVLAKKISTFPEVKTNRANANEVCFQFPEDVVISEKDLQMSILDKENANFLNEMKIPKEDVEDAPVFTNEERRAITTRFTDKMDDTIDKALRENNYPSFSLWDFDSPKGFDEIFKYFFNEHGLVLIFFDMRKLLEDGGFESTISSIKKYFRPIDLAVAAKKELTVKVMIVGTFLDLVLKSNEKLTTLAKQYEDIAVKEGLSLDTSKESGHFQFLVGELEAAEDVAIVEEVRKVSQMFNVSLLNELNKNQRKHLVANDGDNLMFFPLGNDIPELGKTFKKDFDDISGINKFRKRVRELLDMKNGIPINEVMSSLRDASVIDKLIERKTSKTSPDDDHTSEYISREDFQQMAAKNGITSQASLAVLLRYLDVTGIVSWQVGSQTLQDIIILDPNYLVKGLHNFYAGNSGDFAEAFCKELEKAGLVNHLDEWKKNRIITQDLLEKTLCQNDKDKFEFFKAFLLKAFHLNNFKPAHLKEVFGGGQNLTELTEDIDDSYIVPSFQEDFGNMSQYAPTVFRFKLVPSSKMLAKGTFERALSMVIASFVSINLGHEREKNSFILTSGKARFQFNNDVIFFSKEKEDVNDREGFLLFAFETVDAVNTFFQPLKRVMDKMESDHPDDCKFNGFVWFDTKFVGILEAKNKKLNPYFNQDSEVVKALDFTNNFDNI